MQKERLTALEEAINKNRRSFYVIGKALKEIRDDRLYRFLLFKTFEAYTRARWEIGKSQAYRLIEACHVMDNLGTFCLKMNPRFVRWPLWLLLFNVKHGTIF